MSPTLSEPTAATPSPLQHDAHGHFAKGNRGGPGNPFGRQLAAFRAAVFRAATPERVQRIADALLTKAEEGDVAAARLILPYVLGRPGPAPDLERLDLELWKMARDSAAAAEAEPPANAVPAGRPAETAPPAGGRARADSGRGPRAEQSPKGGNGPAPTPPAPMTNGSNGADQGQPCSDAAQATASCLPMPNRSHGWPDWAVDLLQGPEGDGWRALLSAEYGPPLSPNGV